uniref:Uncharacterized protein n=1 Tax=Entomoneis paludosa TaxID=265537 RepID=A0A7S2YT99_9STRA
MLGALKQERLERMRRQGRTTPPANDPINFVLVSTDPEALADFETPFGNFIGLKRQGETMMQQDFPSLKSVALQMGRYDDNFVEEGLPISFDTATNSQNEDAEAESGSSRTPTTVVQRKINRRDAARAAVEALTKPELLDQTVQVYTATKNQRR